ncbi:uncharacterized protein [Dermacentor albipictus]|uniref:uncharacterized protein n=1 Tax=Dermacentor albipictus TaxID=60249 RepID=UPI0038FC25C5
MLYSSDHTEAEGDTAGSEIGNQGSPPQQDDALSLRDNAVLEAVVVGAAPAATPAPSPAEGGQTALNTRGQQAAAAVAPQAPRSSCSGAQVVPDELGKPWTSQELEDALMSELPEGLQTVIDGERDDGKGKAQDLQVGDHVAGLLGKSVLSVSGVLLPTRFGEEKVDNGAPLLPSSEEHVVWSEHLDVSWLL